MANGGPTREELVALYKGLLRAIIDRNPSGLRLRIAKQLSTHRSFVSQITNPADKTPIPARHLPTLFEICHFTPEERTRFLSAYTAAHPRHAKKMDAERPGRTSKALRIEVPLLSDAKRQRALEKLLEDMAKKLADILQ